MIDERTEQLIARRLDGELRPGESLELDKWLIRSPEARQAYEDSLEIDRLAGQTLHGLLNGPAGRRAAMERPAGDHPRWNRKGRYRYGWGLAAAIGLMIAGSPLRPFAPPRQADSADFAAAGALGNEAFSTWSSTPVTYKNTEPGNLAGVVRGPRQYRQQIDEEVIGVVDPETGAVYLLEVRTTRDIVNRVRANY